jgi:hypothetical protein
MVGVNTMTSFAFHAPPAPLVATRVRPPSRSGRFSAPGKKRPIGHLAKKGWVALRAASGCAVVVAGERSHSRDAF